MKSITLLAVSLLALASFIAPSAIAVGGVSPTAAVTLQASASSDPVKVSIPNGTSTNTASPGYSPATITVVIGTNNTVTWTNNDIAVHTVTANDKSFDSGDIAPGASFSFTFTTPGTYPYHCIYHSWMSGTVIVKAAEAVTATTSSTSPQTSSTTTSSTSTGGGVPEFPFQLLVVSAFTALVVASYLLARRRQASGGLIGSSSA